MKKQELIEANFKVLRENGEVAIIECPRCGIEFDVHMESSKNMAYIKGRGVLVACCPLCGTVQKS